jgi:hypothetical protein
MIAIEIVMNAIVDPTTFSEASSFPLVKPERGVFTEPFCHQNAIHKKLPSLSDMQLEPTATFARDSQVIRLPHVLEN